MGLPSEAGDGDGVGGPKTSASAAKTKAKKKDPPPADERGGPENDTPVKSPPPKKQVSSNGQPKSHATKRESVQRCLQFNKTVDAETTLKEDCTVCYAVGVMQDNEKLRKQLDEMKKAMAAKASGSNDPEPKTRPKAKAKCKAKAKAKSAPAEPDAELSANDEDPEADEDEGEEEEEQELSEAAKRQRLRRLCERKGSGKLHVPLAIHEMWLQGGHTRDELVEELEKAGWSKDGGLGLYSSYRVSLLQEIFVKKVLRSKETIVRKQGTKKRGWYTAERMKVKLGWSKQLGGNATCPIA